MGLSAVLRQYFGTFILAAPYQSLLNEEPFDQSWHNRFVDERSENLIGRKGRRTYDQIGVWTLSPFFDRSYSGRLHDSTHEPPTRSLTDDEAGYG
jgi:hypothetical protein